MKPHPTCKHQKPEKGTSNSFVENSKGFSLVEILVSIGLISVLALATVGGMKLLTQSTDYGDKSQGLISLASQIRERTKYSNLCDSTIGTASTYNQNNIDLANPEIRVRIPNINAGVSQTDDFVSSGQIIAHHRLRVDSLTLANVTNVSGTRYVGQVMMTASAIDGIAFKPVYVSTVQVEIEGTSPNMSITKCVGVESVVTKTVCETMGCSWDASAASQNCKCLQANGLCPLGELPIAVKMGMPDCRPIGGMPCGANEYLVGLGIEKSICAPATDSSAAIPPPAGPPAAGPPAAGPPAATPPLAGPTPTPTPTPEILCWQASPPAGATEYRNASGKYECLRSGICPTAGQRLNAQKCNEYNPIDPPPGGPTFLGAGWTMRCQPATSLADADCVDPTTPPLAGPTPTPTPTPGPTPAPTGTCTVRLPTSWDDGANGDWFCDARGGAPIILSYGETTTINNDNGGRSKSSGLRCAVGLSDCSGSLELGCSAERGLYIISQSCTGSN